MNSLVNMQHTKTMTLKEITDLLGVRHNDAMSTVERMMQDPAFGSATKISYHMPAGYKAREQTIQTYQLDKRQSIAVAARLNVAMLMRIIDRWQELEQGDYARLQAENTALKAIVASTVPRIEKLELNQLEMFETIKYREPNDKRTLGSILKISTAKTMPYFDRLVELGYLQLGKPMYYMQRVFVPTDKSLKEGLVADVKGRTILFDEEVLKKVLTDPELI